jgi:DNA-binding GntR family transcriptional regulator
MQVLWAKYPFDLINLIGGRVGRAAQEHGDILKAIAAGDEPAALTAVRKHIEAGWRELQKELEQTSSGLPNKVAAP